MSMIDKILALLKKSGLAWSQKLLPHQVGCHPRNRDGLGISTSEVHGLITDIVQVGFSPEEVRCICFETDPSKTEVVDFNRRLHQESAGKLASLNTELIRYASVAGSHLNAGLNCWIHGVMHDNQPSMHRPRWETVTGKIVRDGQGLSCSLHRGPAMAGGQQPSSS